MQEKAANAVGGAFSLEKREMDSPEYHHEGMDTSGGYREAEDNSENVREGGVSSWLIGTRIYLLFPPASELMLELQENLKRRMRRYPQTCGRKLVG